MVPKEEVPTLSTCMQLARMDLFREIGGFDEYFFYLYDDADLSDRLRKLGYRLAVDPEVKVWHHFSDEGRIQRDHLTHHYYYENPAPAFRHEELRHALLPALLLDASARSQTLVEAVRIHEYPPALRHLPHQGVPAHLGLPAKSAPAARRSGCEPRNAARPFFYPILIQQSEFR